MDGFIERTQATVTGDVRLRLSAGLARITGRRSPLSLYDTGLATYSEGDTFDRESATGFMELYSLSYRTVAAVRRNNQLNALPESDTRKV
jgi:argininosuccinate synthase